MLTTNTSEQGLTFAEASEQLRVPKKTLRHVLSRPDRKSRLLREYRNTKKGLITVEIIPTDLVEELTATLRSVATPPDWAEEHEEVNQPAETSSDEDAPSEEQSAPLVAGTPINLSASAPDQSQPSAGDARLIVATYERLLSDKDARLADLHAALDAERENARQLAQALAREQETVAHLTKRAQPEPQQRSWLWRLLFGGTPQ